MRLRELRADQIVVLEDKLGYRLTTLGEDLSAALDPLRDWAARWADRVEAEK